MNIEKNKVYRIKKITENYPLYMNYGLIEGNLIKIIDKISTGKTIYLEIIGFNRKLALSDELINNIILEDVKNTEFTDDNEK